MCPSQYPINNTLTNKQKEISRNGVSVLWCNLNFVHFFFTRAFSNKFTTETNVSFTQLHYSLLPLHSRFQKTNHFATLFPHTKCLFTTRLNRTNYVWMIFLCFVQDYDEIDKISPTPFTSFPHHCFPPNIYTLCVGIEMKCGCRVKIILKISFVKYITFLHGKCTYFRKFEIIILAKGNNQIEAQDWERGSFQNYENHDWGEECHGLPCSITGHYYTNLPQRIRGSRYIIRISRNVLVRE